MGRVPGLTGRRERERGIRTFMGQSGTAANVLCVIFRCISFKKKSVQSLLLIYLWMEYCQIWIIYITDPVLPGLFYLHLCYSLIESVSQ